MTLAVIGGTAIFILYPLAWAIRRFKHESDRPGAARVCVAAGIVLVLGIWALVKGTRELGMATDPNTAWVQLGTVVGFSYFIFRGINVLYIHSLVNLPERGPWRILYFSIFPTTITSGPIQKYTDFCRDLADPLKLELHVMGGLDAIFRILCKATPH